MPGAAGGAVARSAHPTSHEEPSLPSDNHITAHGVFSCIVIFFFLTARGLPAQENAPGPLTPPPEHSVRRVVGVPEAEAPPRCHPR